MLRRNRSFAFFMAKGEGGGGTKGTKGTKGDVTFFGEESNKEPVCDVKVKLIKLEGGTAAPVAGKIRVSGSAQAPSVPLNISPSVVLRTPCADFIGVPRGVVGRDNQARRGAIVGECTHPKTSP